MGAGRGRRPRRAPEPPSTGRRIGLTLLVIALLGTFGGIGSWAAWTVSDANAGNTFTSTSILLSDNQGGQAGTATSSGTAIFSVTNLTPGSAATTQCIGVDIAGTASVSTLQLSAALAGSTGGGAGALDGQLTMNVATLNTSGTVTTNGTNTNSGSCASYPAGGSNTTVGSQGATLFSWAGAGPYTIASPVTDTWYKFTVSGLPGGASCASYCGKTLTVTLTWTLTTT